MRSLLRCLRHLLRNSKRRSAAKRKTGQSYGDTPDKLIAGDASPIRFTGIVKFAQLKVVPGKRDIPAAINALISLVTR